MKEGQLDYREPASDIRHLLEFPDRRISLHKNLRESGQLHRNIRRVGARAEMGGAQKHRTENSLITLYMILIVFGTSCACRIKITTFVVVFEIVGISHVTERNLNVIKKHFK